MSLADLAREFGTPLYVYSAAHILSRFDLFRSQFSDQAHSICYALKANSSLALLKLLAREGAGFDIVSGGELERVQRACPEALSRVVFSGVGKQVWEMDRALRANILLFNVESEAELEALGDRAKALGVSARFALRVNPDVLAHTHPYISTGLRQHKFGIEIERARAIYQAARSRAGLEAAGVSVHIGSQIRDVEPFAAALSRAADLMGELRTDGHDIRYIDVGGGLGVSYDPAEDFRAEAVVARYAEALRPILSAVNAHLLLEPGRFLVSQAGGLLTHILLVKQSGEKTFLVTDAGMNDLIRPSLYEAYHGVVPVLEPRDSATEVVDVVGPVCETGDFLARDRKLPIMSRGDLALILDAGAYGMSLASNYNTRVRPAEVLIEQGRARIIRRRETLDDLLAPELDAGA